MFLSCDKVSAHTLWNALPSAHSSMCKLFFKEVPQHILGEAFPDCLRSSYSFLWVFMIPHGSVISCVIIMLLPTVSLSRAGRESYSCFYSNMVLTTSSCSLNDRLINEWIDQWTNGWMVRHAQAKNLKHFVNKHLTS